MIAGCSGGHDEFSFDRPEGFLTDIILPTTPVRNQGHTQSCWIYAMLAAIETDRLAQGDSITLSPLWLEYQNKHSTLNTQHSTLSERGILPMAMRLIDDYGLVTDDAYHDSTYYPPQMVYLYGAEYTPKEFAHSCCLPGQWQAYTSFTHHPFGRPFVLELKDNLWHQTAMNIPIESLLNSTVESIRRRHPVAWEGCMKRDLLDDRQEAFEDGDLTDDHCMCIVGIGHDKKGVRYFVLKNSWGTKDGDHGFKYMSFDRFCKSTILLMLKKD